MTAWIVIPFRGPEGAKSRLASELCEAERHAITVVMFQRVLAATAQAQRALVGARLLVLTPSPSAAAIAERASARVLMEDAGSLNGALELARITLRRDGPGTMAVIAADLPDLTAADVRALLSERGEGLAIAPDHTGRGTNALALPLSCDLPFCFGADSLTLHTAAAQRLALPVTVVHRPGLARDIDVPADLPLDKEPPHAD